MSEYDTCGVPPRCFTCGKQISHLYGKFMEELEKKNKSNKIKDYNYDNINNREIIKKLGLHERLCCIIALQTYPKGLTDKL
jgi:DNA-directed RNA polymerase subunit N (RpoN/RPB10)